ncbi:MAG TPA: PH domain-containing protein [Patescibacteria group bacterium]
MYSPDGTRTIHHIRESVIPISLQLITGLFLINGLYAVILAYLLLPEINVVQNEPVLSIAFLLACHAIAFILQVVVSLKLLLPWIGRNYYIAGNHLIRTQGVIVADEDVFDLHSLRSVHIHENWLGRLLNYGDIHILVAASGYRAEVIINAITNPREYERIFRKFLEGSDQPLVQDEIVIDSVPSKR